MAESDNTTNQSIVWPDLSAYGLRVLFTRGKDSGKPFVVLTSLNPDDGPTTTRARLSQYRENLRSVLTRQPGEEVYGKPVGENTQFALTGPGIARISALFNALERGFPEATMRKQPTTLVMLNRYQRWLAARREKQANLITDQPAPQTGQGQPSSLTPDNPTTDEGAIEGEVGTPDEGGRGNVQHSEGATPEGVTGGTEGADPALEGGSGNVQDNGTFSDDGLTVVIHNGDIDNDALRRMLESGRQITFGDDPQGNVFMVINPGGEPRWGIRHANALGDNQRMGLDPREPVMDRDTAVSEAITMIRSTMAQGYAPRPGGEPAQDGDNAAVSGGDSPEPEQDKQPQAASSGEGERPRSVAAGFVVAQQTLPDEYGFEWEDQRSATVEGSIDNDTLQALLERNVWVRPSADTSGMISVRVVMDSSLTERYGVRITAPGPDGQRQGVTVGMGDDDAPVGRSGAATKGVMAFRRLMAGDDLDAAVAAAAAHDGTFRPAHQSSLGIVGIRDNEAEIDAAATREQLLEMLASRRSLTIADDPNEHQVSVVYDEADDTWHVRVEDNQGNRRTEFNNLGDEAYAMAAAAQRAQTIMGGTFVLAEVLDNELSQAAQQENEPRPGADVSTGAGAQAATSASTGNSNERTPSVAVEGVFSYETIPDDQGFEWDDDRVVDADNSIENDTLQALLERGAIVRPMADLTGFQTLQVGQYGENNDRWGVRATAEADNAQGYETVAVGIESEDAVLTREGAASKGVMLFRRLLAGDNLDVAANRAASHDGQFPPGHLSSMGLRRAGAARATVDSAATQEELLDLLSTGRNLEIADDPQGHRVEVGQDEADGTWFAQVSDKEDVSEIIAGGLPDEAQARTAAALRAQQIMVGGFSLRDNPVTATVHGGQTGDMLKETARAGMSQQQGSNDNATAVSSLSTGGSEAGTGLESRRDGSGADLRGHERDAGEQRGAGRRGQRAGDDDRAGAGEGDRGPGFDGPDPAADPDAADQREGPADPGESASSDSGDLSRQRDGGVRAGDDRGDDRGPSADDAQVGGTASGPVEVDPDAAAAATERDRSGVSADGADDSGSAERPDADEPGQPDSQHSERPDAADAGARDGDGRDRAATGTGSAAGGDQPLGFRFEPGHDYEGKAPQRRVQDNFEAMQRLFEIEREGRTPDDEDKAILAEYSGWGGVNAHMFSYFSHKKPGYVQAAEDQLLALRDDDATPFDQREYQSIKSTILNAHFTHEGVIRPCWEALSQMGIRMERALEPSCGTLDFISHAPTTVDGLNQVTGVEIDPISARIAQAIHPEHKVHNKPLEEVDLPDSFFDLSVSNVPFGNYQVYDRDHPEWRDSIHNYFVKKQLDLLRPGGVSAFVISRYFMDSEDDSIREYVMNHAHVANVVRLPSKAFSQNTQTDVTTDLVILQKKGNFTPNFEPLDIRDSAVVKAPFAGGSEAYDNDGNTIYPGEDVNVRVNRLFHGDGERVVGDLVAMTGQYRLEPGVQGATDIEGIEDELRTVLNETTPSAITQPPRSQSPDGEWVKQQFASTTMREDAGSAQPGEIVYRESSGEFHRVEGSADNPVLSDEPVKVAKTQRQRMRALVELMGTTKTLLEVEAAGDDAETEQRAAELRQDLNAQYDAFTKRYGALLDRKNQKLFRMDVREPFLYGLEYEDPATGESKKTALFERRTVSPTVNIPDHAETLTDALALSMTYTGEIAPAYMADLLGGDYVGNPQRVVDELVERELAFIDPETEKPVPPEFYLSGNLKPKIDAAEKAAQADSRFARNVEALKEALPEPLQPSQISVGLDSFWVPKHIMEDFFNEVLDISTASNSGVRPVFDTENRHWILRQNHNNTSFAEVARRNSQVAMHRWGTERCDMLRLLGHAFTNTQPTVRDKISTNPDRYEVNQEETLKAQGKLEEIKEAWDNWVFRDGQRARELTDIYNERFNTIRMHEPDGSHMVYPGMAEGWVPRKHQNDFVWRALSGGNCMTAHTVGAGKTFQLVSTAIRGKQMGRWNKPMCVVPNHMLRQFAGDAQALYPSARILVVDKEDISPSKRGAFVARAAAGDWDLVICTHSSFSRIGVPEDFEIELLENEKERLRTVIEREDRENQGSKSPTQKDVEKKLKNLEAKLKRKMDEASKNDDNVLDLGSMGIDHLGIDEAHYYKNLAPDTAKQIPGVSVKESVRAWDMLMKCRYMQSLHGGDNGVLMATGTPISNSLVECYTFMRMLRPQMLSDMGIENFNDWMSLFAEVSTSLEIKPEGGGYHNKARLSEFKNVPELLKLFRQFVDVKTREDLDLPCPDVKHETVVAEQTPLMSAFMKYIEARARAVRGPKGADEPDESVDDARQPDSGANDEVAKELARRIRRHIHGANNAAMYDASGIFEHVEKLPDDILLSIATDGKKASLDPRLIHPELPDDPGSKVNLMIDKAMDMHHRYESDKACQMIFCDNSSPTGKGKFNLYDDIRDKLIERGVEPSEIAYIHDAKTDEDKEKLFEKCRAGEVRFLLGSTDKMGVGTNIQERLVAMHQMDPPWRPSDIEQRLGRMDRQGNSFDEVYNFTYSTKDSFDLFVWETLKRKQKMIATGMRHPDQAERVIEEDAAMSFEDVLQVTTGNERIKEFMDTRQQLDKLKRFQASHINEQADMGDRINRLEETTRRMEAILAIMEQDQQTVQANQPLHLEVEGQHPGLQEGDCCHIGGAKGLANALETQASLTRHYTTREIGTFGGLTVMLSRNKPEVPKIEIVTSDGNTQHVASVNTRELFEDDEVSENKMPPWEKAARTLAREVDRIGSGKPAERQRELLEERRVDLEKARADYGAEFPRQQELNDLEAKYQQLLSEVGEELDNEKGMDPAPVIDFVRYLNEHTSTPLYQDQLEEIIGDAWIGAPDQVGEPDPPPTLA